MLLSNFWGLAIFSKLRRLLVVGWEEPVCSLIRPCPVKNIVSVFFHSKYMWTFFYSDEPLISNLGGTVCLVPYWNTCWVFPWYRHQHGIVYLGLHYSPFIQTFKCGILNPCWNCSDRGLKVWAETVAQFDTFWFNSYSNKSTVHFSMIQMHYCMLCSGT